MGSEPGLAWSAYYFAVVARGRGDTRAARRHLEDALVRLEAMGHRPGIAAALLHAAALESLDGDAGRGARLLGAARALHARAVVSLSPIETTAIDETNARLRARLGDGPFAAEVAAGEALPLQAAVGLARGALATPPAGTPAGPPAAGAAPSAAT